MDREECRRKTRNIKKRDRQTISASIYPIYFLHSILLPLVRSNLLGAGSVAAVLELQALLGVLGECLLEVLLDGLESLLVLLSAEEGNTGTVGTETTGTTDTVLVGGDLLGHVVVDGQVDALEIDTTAENVRGNADTQGVALLELLVDSVTLLLLHVTVNVASGEVELLQNLGQLLRAGTALDEDHDLVDVQLVKNVHKLADLLVLGQEDVELAHTVKGQLDVVLNKVLSGVLQELPAYRQNLLGQGGREHHDLLLAGSGAENVLDIAAHLCSMG